MQRTFPGGVSGEEPTCQCRRHTIPRFDSWVREMPWGGHGNSLQYPCLKDPMDRGVWWTTVHNVTKSWTQLRWLNTYAHNVHRQSLIYDWTLWWCQSNTHSVETVPWILVFSWASKVLHDKLSWCCRVAASWSSPSFMWLGGQTTDRLTTILFPCNHSAFHFW